VHDLPHQKNFAMDESFKKIFDEISSIRRVVDSLQPKTSALSAFFATRSLAEGLSADHRRIAEIQRSFFGNYKNPIHHWIEQNNALREMVTGDRHRWDVLRNLGDRFSISNSGLMAAMLKESAQWSKLEFASNLILKQFDGHDIFNAFKSNTIGHEFSRLCELSGGVHRTLSALSVSGRYGDLFTEYEALTASVREVTLPVFDYDFSGRLGKTFSVNDLLAFRRSDDAQRYLRRTELPSDFVSAPSRLVGAACIDLGVLEPLPRRQVKRVGDRQLKKMQVSRSLRELQLLLQWLEGALREKVERVMTEQSGADWARTTHNATVIRWARLYDKKQQSVWHASFKPARVVDASYFSELMEFAFLSGECSMHILAFSSISETEIKAEIGRVNDARNSLMHGSVRIDEHVFGFIRGIIIKLACLAGLTPPYSNTIGDSEAEED